MIRIRSIAPLTCALLLPGVARGQDPRIEKRVVLAMGARLSIQCGGAGEKAFSAASEAAIAECARIEAACSTWKPESAWSRLNAAEGKALPLNQEWISLLAQALAWSHRTKGAFDPVLFRLLAAYGVREGGKTPSEIDLKKARKASGSEHLRLDRVRGTASLREGAGVEEGGFVKGYALDCMRDQLVRHGIQSGWLDFGGQLLAFGQAKPVSIADPKDRTVPRFSILLNKASLASSGLSEHGHHIVDPRTGRLCEDWGSVSVVAASGLDADCLSTALYVMGPEEGLAWASRQHIAAIFLLNDGAARMSPAFTALHPVSIPLEKP